jgi:hypothetical protein
VSLLAQNVFNYLTVVYVQGISEKMLVNLLGVDPTKNPTQPLPTNQPQVTFAYLKHMWKSNLKACLLK